MTELVRIGQSGRRACVTLDPPVSGMTVMTRFPDFSQAVGFAIGHSIGLARRVADDTGRLTDAQLAELQFELVRAGIEEGLKRVARCLPFLPADAEN